MTVRRKNLKISLGLLLTGGCLMAHGLLATSQAAQVSETRVRETVIAHVKEKLQTLVTAEDKDRIVVTVLTVPSAPLNFPELADEKSVHITADSSLDTMYSERTVVRVHLQNALGQDRELGVPVHITIKKPVWIVKNAIRANEPLRLSDFKLETREVSHNYGYVVGQERTLQEYIARVNLRPGELLDSRKIVVPPDVSCNSEVRIFMSNGNGMTVSVPGIALANGRIGETIRVRQTQFQRKAFSAKVINKNRVLVEM